jgi:hypothetical protein
MYNTHNLSESDRVWIEILKYPIGIKQSLSVRRRLLGRHEEEEKQNDTITRSEEKEENRFTYDDLLYLKISVMSFLSACAYDRDILPDTYRAFEN